MSAFMNDRMASFSKPTIVSNRACSQPRLSKNLEDANVRNHQGCERHHDTDDKHDQHRSNQKPSPRFYRSFDDWVA